MQKKNNFIANTFCPTEIDFENFTQILATLNHVQPKYISRAEYEELSGDILSVVGTDTVGDIYKLFLPDDLNKTELGELIYFLTEKFHIEKYAQLEKTISQVKLFVELIARKLPESEKNDFTQKLIQESHISPELLSIIRNQKLLFGPSREILKSFEGENLSPEQLLLEIEDILQKEFYLTFFRKGVNMLRLRMMTMTAGEIPAIKKKEGDIQVNIYPRELDKTQRLLREKIGIDDLKNELLQAEKIGNKVIVERIKSKATHKILKVLHEFPFQLTKDDYGFQPSKILETKELYCIGFSILGHVFLSELGIEHYGLSIPEHSALEVVLDGKRYYFDATTGTHLFKIKKLKDVGVYEYVDLEEAGKKYIHKGEAEKVLFGHIFNNLSVTLIQEGKYKQAIIMLEKSISIYPTETFTYKLMGDCYFMLHDYNKALEYVEIAGKLKPNDPDILNLYAICISGLKKYEESLKIFDEILKIDGDLVDVYRNKALSYYFLGRFEEALAITQKGLKKFPKDHLLHFGKAGILVKMKRYSEALMMLDTLYDVYKNDTDYYFNRGEIFEKTGNIFVGKLYYFISDLLSGKEVMVENQEEKAITELVLSKDFEGLKNFMISLEKNSN